MFNVLTGPWFADCMSLFRCNKRLYAYWAANCREAIIERMICEHRSQRRATLDTVRWGRTTLYAASYAKRTKYTLCGRVYSSRVKPQHCKCSLCRVFNIEIGTGARSRQYIYYNKHDIINGLVFKLYFPYHVDCNITTPLHAHMGHDTRDYRIIICDSRSEWEIVYNGDIHLDLYGPVVDCFRTACEPHSLSYSATPIAAFMASRIGDIIAYMRSPMVDSVAFLGADLRALARIRRVLLFVVHRGKFESAARPLYIRLSLHTDARCTDSLAVHYIPQRVLYMSPHVCPMAGH